MKKTNTSCSRCGGDREGRHPYCSACRASYRYEKTGRREAAKVMRAVTGGQR